VPERLLATAAALIASITVAAAAEPAWVALSIDAAGGVVAPVTVNGAGPFLFLVDTGSSGSVISDALAHHLDLETLAATSVLTSTGRDLRPVVRLDLTAIGAVRSEGLLVSVVPSSRLSAIARGIAGIIGQDFLSGFNYTLDYRRRRLSWTAGGVLDGDARLPLIARNGRYLVEIPSSNTSPLRLVPDSGTSGLVVYAHRGRTRIALDPPAGEMAVHSLSGRQSAQTMWLRELNLGCVTVRNQPVAVIAREAADLPDEDGLLPLHLFDSVSFSARDGYIVLRPRR
jgi:predicted aspartyl protease